MYTIDKAAQENAQKRMNQLLWIGSPIVLALLALGPVLERFDEISHQTMLLIVFVGLTLLSVLVVVNLHYQEVDSVQEILQWLLDNNFEESTESISFNGSDAAQKMFQAVLDDQGIRAKIEHPYYRGSPLSVTRLLLK